MKGSPALRNGGGKSRFWTPSWLFLTSWTCGFSVFYVKEASCLISSSSATFTLSSFSSSMTSLISSSTCPILTFYTFLETSDQMLVNGEVKKVDLKDFVQLFRTSILKWKSSKDSRLKQKVDSPNTFLFLPSTSLLFTICQHLIWRFQKGIKRKYWTSGRWYQWCHWGGKRW